MEKIIGEEMKTSRDKSRDNVHKEIWNKKSLAK